MQPDVIVIGSGVIGLTSAVRLAESGRRVAVWTREPAERTTSAVAGGLWWPYRIEPRERVADWSLRSYEVYAALAEDPAETGVRMVAGTHAGTAVKSLGPWAARIPGLRDAGPDELPAGYTDAVRASVPIVDTAVHLGHLRRRLEAAGGVVVPRAVGSLDEAGTAAPLVVNCAGLGARELVPDDRMRPVRGQIVVVEDPGVDEWFVAADWSATDTAYVLPQPYGVVLGGTAHEDAWDLTPDPATADAVQQRCARYVPGLAGAKVLAHRVGLRPYRTGVRLEAEALPGGARCVHNYGHGGAGVTVAWGCAEEAVRLGGG